jgi:hypothetical protein
MIHRNTILATPVLLTAVILASAAIAQIEGFKTDTSKTIIELDELRSGGPGKDGIPPIDEPKFISVEVADKWLKPQEPVVAVEIEDAAKAYPLQILIWHEIVNDTLGKTPVAVTFCPLCYSAIVFDRRFDNRTLTLGVSGFLRYSDMVMYDRQTETLWQQFAGQGLVGQYAGKHLTKIPAQIISFEQFRKAYPQAQVLSKETGHKRAYGRNPYSGYDDINKSPFLYRGPKDDRLPPMEKVISVTIDDKSKAYPYSITQKKGVIHDTVGGTTIVVFHGKGAVSALDRGKIDESKQAGSTGVFLPVLDGQTLAFQKGKKGFIDAQTQSTWDITGKAIDGELKGKQLKRLVHGDYFAFAWLVFEPETDIYLDH